MSSSGLDIRLSPLLDVVSIDENAHSESTNESGSVRCLVDEVRFLPFPSRPRRWGRRRTQQWRRTSEEDGDGPSYLWRTYAKLVPIVKRSQTLGISEDDEVTEEDGSEVCHLVRWTFSEQFWRMQVSPTGFPVERKASRPSKATIRNNEHGGGGTLDLSSMMVDATFAWSRKSRPSTGNSESTENEVDEIAVPSQWKENSAFGMPGLIVGDGDPESDLYKQDGADYPALAVCSREGLVWYEDSGEVYPVSLASFGSTSSRMERIFPLPTGVMVQTVDTAEHGQAFNSIPRRNQFFSDHPFFDMQSVSFRDQFGDLMDDGCVDVFFASIDVPIIAASVNGGTFAIFSGSLGDEASWNLLFLDTNRSMGSVEAAELYRYPAFLAHDIDEQILLCVPVGRTNLFGFRVEFSADPSSTLNTVNQSVWEAPSKITPSFRLHSVMAAFSVISTRKERLDIVLVTAEGQIQLQIGGHPVLVVGSLPVNSGGLRITRSAPSSILLLMPNGNSVHISFENAALRSETVDACFALSRQHLDPVDYIAMLSNCLQRKQAYIQGGVPLEEWRCLWEFFSDSRATIDQLRRVDSASSKWEVLEQLGLSEVSVSQFNLASKISSITYSYIPWVDGLDAIRRRIASRLLPMISRMEEASGMDRLKRKVQLELKELASTMRDLVGVPEETNDIKPPCFLYEGFRGGISAFHALIAGVQHHETNSMSCTATQCDVPMNEIDGENGEGQPLHMIPRVRLPSELCCRISGVLKHLLDPELTPAQVLLSLDQNCVGSSDFERLPFGIAIPILDGIWRRSRDISPVARAKLGLVHAEGGRVRNPDRWMAETYSRLQKGFEFRSEKSEVIVNEDIFDGCDMSGASTIEFRFSRDRRVAEVRRILRSSRPATLPINQLLEGGGASHDHQEVLLKCIARLLANPIGRGAFTFATQPISSFTKKAMIPKICLAGRIPDRQGALVHLTSESIPEGFLDWPMFHNGVAAGLRLRLDDPTSDSLSLRAWITDHLPSGNSFPAENSGLLLGLGLTGVLDSLKITDWYQFLLKQDELLSCAILLGVAAGKKGSMDNVVAKMLCLHIRYFNKNGFAQPDWSVSKPTQSAAMVGLGILYLGTNQRMIVEGLLHELTASIRPGDSAQGRESLSLAAGYGLGLTCLGAGRSAGGVLDLNIEDRLCRLIFGGQVDSRQSVDDTNRIDSISEANNDTEPILVVDGTLSNTSVTAPGAILALCLMYLKSDDRVIAEKLSIRESHFALECLRPEHLLLLVVCRSLVLWSEISPDVTWITNVMPKILQSSEGPLDFSLPVVDTGRLHHVDPEGIQQARVACVTGACMAIALKFAGTCEIRSFELIIAALDHVEKASKSFAVAEQDIWQTCTLQLVLALSVLTSGSGNLRCLRHLRRMYRQSIKSSFAHYIAISSAIGLLFLGGGCWTLGGSLSDIAFLLIALYPRFPSEPRDNLYHLQALRHLFALSAERRLLEPRDFDTGELCCVPIRLFLKETNDFQSGVKNVFAPCIIPPLHQISHIEVLGPRFWPSIYMLSSDAPQRLRKSPIAISVKRKSGYLPYLEDPRGFRGIFSRSLDPSHRLGEEFVRRFSENALAHSFARYLGNHPDPDRASFWRSALLECTIHNKLDAVILYMDVDRAMRNVIGRDCRGSSVASPICSLSDAYNLNMLRAYYDSSVPEWRKQVYAKETNHAIQLDKDLIPSDLRSSFFVLLEDQLIRSGKTEYSSETDPMVVSCCSRSQMVNGFREG